jgi:hypothetical protein
MRLCQDFRFFGAVVTTVLSGCNLDSGFDPSEPPAMRVVNASTVGAVTVHLDGTPTPLATVASNAATPNCPLLAPGTHVISFLENGQLRDEFTSGYARDKQYVIVLTNSGATFRSFSIATDQQVDATSNGLTLINGTTAAGDVYATAVAADPSPATKVATNLPPAATTTTPPPFIVTPSANLRIRLYDVGSVINPRADITLQPLLEQRLGVVVFTDRIVGTDPGALQVDPCEPI